MIFAGIDTSNYTTSVALIDDGENLLANIKIPLPVAKGERGLRQSEAVFAHVKNLPVAMGYVSEVLGGRKIDAVGVSEKPRNLEGSYMPCFLSGVVAAQSLAALGAVPIFRFSHQCGHIMAAVYSSGAFELLDGEFAAFHVSGGTTELLRVSYLEGVGFSADLVGGTRDLNAGQVIDRVGVAMGMSFPCGAEMEKAALEYTGKIPKKKVSFCGMEVNLSGLENMALKLYSETGDKGLTSAFVLDYIGGAIEKMSEEYEGNFGKSRFVYAGGVMSNSIIKARLAKRFDAFFAEPAMSSDNAVGIAYLTKRAYFSE